MNLSHRTVETQLFHAVKTLQHTLQPFLTTKRKSSSGVKADVTVLLAVLLSMQG